MPISPDAAVTVFCAVWSGDADRHDLLRGHQATLDAQTVPVLPRYVFDAADEPPAWVRGHVLVAGSPLTIYQAWSVATQRLITPYVANLNLDDRLRADAIERMQAAAGTAHLVGGDWRVTYDQPTTDAATGTPAAPVSDLPFDPAWPPTSGTSTRLGSGTGDRGTLGPATLWHAALHDRVPYPSAFADGTPIRVVGDLAWWTVATGHLQAVAARLPMIIGHYHSHPGEQAEFRASDETTALDGGIAIAPHPLTDVHDRGFSP